MKEIYECSCCRARLTINEVLDSPQLDNMCLACAEAVSNAKLDIDGFEGE